jgi:2-oxoglutarate ferredoxin oxidoreductase subunit beta
MENALDPAGNPNRPLNPVALAVALETPFVARGFAREKDHLKEIIKEAVLFKGTAIVDILQPCVSFNKINTYQWYGERVFELESPATDRYEAIALADLWGDRIPIGVLFRNDQVPARRIPEIFRQSIPSEAMRNLLDMHHR